MKVKLEKECIPRDDLCSDLIALNPTTSVLIENRNGPAMTACKRILFIYWAQRRQRTAAQINWQLGAFQAINDASNCLDRPDSPPELSDMA